MSDKDINKMDFKELRNEVQGLRDELAKMKRSYEDILYNLDYDNFSRRVVKDKNGMQTSIKQTAEAVAFQAEKISENDTYYKAQLEITAQGIASEAEARESKDEELSSKITQTANGVESTVKKVVTDTYIKNMLGDEYLTDATFETHFDIYADGIYANVSAEYETKKDAESKYDNLDDYIASVSIEADGLSSKVMRMEAGQFGEYSLFEQTSTGFSLTGDVEIDGDLVSGGVISGVSVGTADNRYGDGIYLNSAENQIEIVYTNAIVGRWGISDSPVGSYIAPAGGAALLIRDARAYGDWDFSECTSVSGLDKFISGGTGGTATAVFG